MGRRYTMDICRCSVIIISVRRTTGRDHSVNYDIVLNNNIKLLGPSLSVKHAPFIYKIKTSHPIWTVRVTNVSGRN